MKPRYDEYGTFLGNDFVPDTMHATGSEEDRQAVAEAICKSLRPAPRDEIETWLAELSVIAPSRADDEMTATLRLEAYSRRLAEFPADMVHHALLGKTWRFFPSWYELEKDLTAMRRERDAMLSACTGMAQHHGNPPPEREERISAERASEILQEVGFKPKRP